MPVIDIALTLAEQKQLDIERREATFSNHIRLLYNPLFSEYRSQLEAHFAHYHSDNVDPETKLASWSPEFGSDRYLARTLFELTDSAEEELAEDFDKEMFEAFDNGFDRTLWEMYVLGIPIEEIEPPDDDFKTGLFTVAAIGGITYLDRLTKWSNQFKTKANSWLRGSIRGGFNLQQTLTGLDSITGGFVGRLVGLGSNELNLSYLLASEVAREPYRRHFKEVWITRGDSGVCPVCAELADEVTTLQPIIDTHPGCRCRKAMVATTESGEIIDYVAFLQSIGRR